MASGNGNRTNAMAQNGVNNGTAASAVGVANPVYQTMATNPTGYTPQQKSDMLTKISQVGGGGTAAAVGQAGLLGARTGNAGGADAAIDDAAQAAGRTQTQGALQVDGQDADLAQRNRDTGLNGLNDIYKTSTGAAVGDLNAANGAGSSFWKQILMQSLQSAGQAGVAAAGA